MNQAEYNILPPLVHSCLPPPTGGHFLYCSKIEKPAGTSHKKDAPALFLH